MNPATNNQNCVKLFSIKMFTFVREYIHCLYSYKTTMKNLNIAGNAITAKDQKNSLFSPNRIKLNKHYFTVNIIKFAFLMMTIIATLSLTSCYGMLRVQGADNGGHREHGNRTEHHEHDDHNDRNDHNDHHDYRNN